MKRFTMAGLALAAVLMFGIASASALTLPEVFAGQGSAFPILISGRLISSGRLLTVAGSELTGTAVEVTIRLAAAGAALGTYDALFINVKEGNIECKTPPLPQGNVLVLGLAHLVYIPPFPRLGGLFLVPTTVVDCGTTANPTKVVLKVDGSVLTSVNGTINKATTTFNGALRGNGGGKAELTTYYSDAGTETSSLLLSNFGLGFEESAGEIEGTVPFVVNGGESIIISAV
jgi:hypothetical protein